MGDGQVRDTVTVEVGYGDPLGIGADEHARRRIEGRNRAALGARGRRREERRRGRAREHRHGDTTDSKEHASDLAISP
jgi:hypothetical protein